MNHSARRAAWIDGYKLANQVDDFVLQNALRYDVNFTARQLGLKVETVQAVVEERQAKKRSLVNGES